MCLFVRGVQSYFQLAIEASCLNGSHWRRDEMMICVDGRGEPVDGRTWAIFALWSTSMYSRHQARATDNHLRTGYATRKWRQASGHLLLADVFIVTRWRDQPKLEEPAKLHHVSTSRLRTMLGPRHAPRRGQQIDANSKSKHWIIF